MAAPARAPLAELLCLIAEPTRLRLLNCLAGAPLVVSDLQAVLELPQPTVSRHLMVLRRARVVHDRPAGPYVLYQVRLDRTARGRLVALVLDALAGDEALQLERHRARERSRSRARLQRLQSSA